MYEDLFSSVSKRKKTRLTVIWIYSHDVNIWQIIQIIHSTHLQLLYVMYWNDECWEADVIHNLDIIYVITTINSWSITNLYLHITEKLTVQRSLSWRLSLSEKKYPAWDRKLCHMNTIFINKYLLNHYSTYLSQFIISH